MSGPRELFRDRWLVVVDKPAGVPTQRTEGGEPGLYEALLERERYVGLHHRLDVPASGLVLFTLDESVNAAIGRAFAQHAIDRRYLAVLDGDVISGRWAWPVEGKPAFSVVEALGHGGGTTAVQVRLETGRKHQIRVQAALAGHPILGDRRYGGSAGRAWPRLALHACSLELVHPITKQRLTVASPLPDDLLGLWRDAGGTALVDARPA